MEKGFIGILQTIIKDHGKAAILDTSKSKALLADYTKGDYKIESRLLFQALEAKVPKAIDNTQEIDICRKQQVRMLHEEYLLIEEHAKDIVDTLVFVLRNIEKEKIFCKKCGKELPDDWKACPYCGETVSSYNKPSNNKTAKPPEQTYGNTQGNITNHGHAVFNDGWIYYCNSENEHIYKIQTDGVKCQKINNERSLYLNAAGDWLYYSNKDDHERLYKIRTDGTCKTRLNTDNRSSNIIVAGDWIYYINYNKIYKIHIDGSQRQKLIDDTSTCFNIAGDWIYYIYSDDNFKIYKIRTDGTQRQLLNEFKSWYICLHDDWIYYQNEDDGEKLYKIKTDGTEQQLLNNDSSYYINTDGDWIFYQNEDDGKLYKIKTDGTKRIKLSNDDTGFINIIEDWIFYINFDDYKLYKMRKDGTDRYIVK